MTESIDFSDPAELDRQYRISSSVSEATFKACIDRYASLSADAAASIACERDIVYDPASGSLLDVFRPPGRPLAPVLVFIHGGYWRMLSKNESAFMAPSFVRNGVAVVPIDYTLAPAATLEEIVRQVRSSINWIHQNGPAHGLDAARIFVAGSSAGGHLTGALFAEGWRAGLNLPPDAVKGLFPISGLFDLRPLTRTFVNEWLKLDETRAAALSPALHLPKAGCPVDLFWGEHETAAFRNQSLLFQQTLLDAGLSGRATEVKDRNHFDVVLDLADEDSQLAQTCLTAILQS